MFVRRRAAHFAAVGALISALASPPRARADEPAADGQRSIAAAFGAFRDGERAFARGDFLQAAISFEAAYRIAPHHDALWNAARAWEGAGELARAANAYDKYLREAPKDASDRDAATRALAALAQKLGRIEVVAPGLVELTVDERPLVAGRSYVVPGAHVVRGRAGDKPLQKTVEVQAGAVVSVALSPEVEAAKPPAPPPSSTTIVVLPPAQAPVRPPFLGRSAKITLIAGSALTAVATGLAVASGVDTLAARARFNTARTPQNLADGESKQRMTNALIGVAAGLGAITLGATLLLGDWKRAPLPAQVSLAASPSSLSIRGAF